jgi:hypothetical protein
LIAREREISRFLRPFTYKDGKIRIALHVFEKISKKFFRSMKKVPKWQRLTNTAICAMLKAER